jgi:hypothetical protein
VDRYDTMIANYALETLGAHLPHPVHEAAAVTAADLPGLLGALPWAADGWHAGHWTDCYASCLDLNARHFALPGPVDALFAWLDAHCDPATGLWSPPAPDTGWHLPVNGFYRLTRGTYAQFHRPLPHPAASLATIHAYATTDPRLADGSDACDTLDVVHPFWLLRPHARGLGPAVDAWLAARLPATLARWRPGRGFAFDPATDEPSLQGTEMWLAIVYLMADTLGLASHLGYRPRGVHRPDRIPA